MEEEKEDIQVFSGHSMNLIPNLAELPKYQAETQKQIETLSQSILVKAFRGEVTIQMCNKGEKGKMEKRRRKN